MTEKSCPRCGETSAGKFCSHCGSSLSERFCNQCGKKTQPGDRFCNGCGAAVGATGPAAAGVPPARSARSGSVPRGAGGGSPDGANTLAWWIAGGLMVALILFVAYPMVAPDDGPGGSLAPAAGSGGPGGVDLGSMTPREAADQLYNRVMAATENGDSAQARQFLPMAVSAYEMARPLDHDGLFHLSSLQRTTGDLEAALATAREGLESAPDHLLLLAAAGEAAFEAGEADAARQYYERLVSVWDAEMAKGLTEYDLHSRMMPELRTEAEAFLER